MLAGQLYITSDFTYTVMHRDYNSNTPTKFYQYSNRLEIVNAGSLYVNAKPHNFPHMNDYRNPLIAEALKVMEYVNKFNRGITRVEHELMENGNGKTTFTVDKITVFEAKVNIATNKIEQTDKFTTLDIDHNNEKAWLILTKLSTIESMSSKELFESLNITNQTYNYGTINKLKKGGFIISTSDKPTSPNQKYAITELGKFYLSYKKGGKQ